MDILADERVDGPVVIRLRKDGHNVQYVAEMDPGIADKEVLRLASDETTLLLTADKDFGELIFRQGYIQRGIVFVSRERPRWKRRKLFHQLLPNTGKNC